MEYFKKIRDYVLGEDLSPDARSPSASRPAKQTAGRHADAQQQSTQQKQQERRAHHEPSSGDGAVPTTAALPRGPGVLRDVPDGGSGGVQGLSWYKAKLRQDADGDVAEQFWSEATLQPTAGGKAIGQPKHPLQVQRKQLKRPQTGSIRVEQGNVDVEIRGQQSP